MSGGQCVVGARRLFADEKGQRFKNAYQCVCGESSASYIESLRAAPYCNRESYF